MLHYLFERRCENVFEGRTTTPSLRAEHKQSVEYSHDIYEFVVEKTNGTSLLIFCLFLSDTVFV